MGIKKVRIIAGAPNIGKTRCIREIARKLYVIYPEYRNLLCTNAAKVLNQSSKIIENDDIFGIFSSPFEKIGVLSAGDGNTKQEVTNCLTFLNDFLPDIIICAAQDDGQHTIENDIKNFYKQSNLCNDVDVITLTKIDDAEVNKVYEQIQSAIRGF